MKRIRGRLEILFLVLGGLSLVRFATALDQGLPLGWFLVLGIVFLGIGLRLHIERLTTRLEQAERVIEAVVSSRQRALDDWAATQGPRSRDVANAHHALALLQWEAGRPDRAEPLLRQALAIWEQTPGPESEEVAGCLTNLGLVAQEQSRYEDAEGLLRRALEVRQRVLGPEHPEVVSSLVNLAHHYHGRRNDPEALRLQRLVIEHREKHPDRDDSRLAADLAFYARLLKWSGRRSEAKAVEARLKELRRKQRTAK